MRVEGEGVCVKKRSGEDMSESAEKEGGMYACVII